MGGWVVGNFRKTLVWRTVAFLLSFFWMECWQKALPHQQNKTTYLFVWDVRETWWSSDSSTQLRNDKQFVRSLARMLCIVLKVRLLLRSPVRYDDEKRRRRCTLVFVDCVVGSREGVKLVRLSVCCCCINVCTSAHTSIFCFRLWFRLRFLAGCIILFCWLVMCVCMYIHMYVQMYICVFWEWNVGM